MFLYPKLIDRSTLRQGFQILVESHHLLKAIPGGMPQHGKTRNVNGVIDGNIIHKVKPVFDRPSISFHFSNGLVEKVKIDKHLVI